MNAQDEFQLAVWQQLREAGLTPEERIQNLDDQVRMDQLLREFYGSEQESRAEFKRQMSCVLVEFPCVITNCSSSLPPSALSSSGV
jgi:hypothetical protein